MAITQLLIENNLLFWTSVFTVGCDSNADVNFSNFKSCYKWYNYFALNNMY